MGSLKSMPISSSLSDSIGCDTELVWCMTGDDNGNLDSCSSSLESCLLIFSSSWSTLSRMSSSSWATSSLRYCVLVLTRMMR